MTKMEKIVLVLTFWHSPWGAAKGAIWEFFTGDRPFTEDEVLHIIGLAAAGKDDKYPKWEELEGFKEYVASQQMTA